MQQVTICARSR